VRVPDEGSETIRHAALTSDSGFEFVNVASAGQIVFVERVDFATIDGKRAGFHVVGVFEVDADGKIASSRDYLDSRERPWGFWSSSPLGPARRRGPWLFWAGTDPRTLGRPKPKILSGALAVGRWWLRLTEGERRETPVLAELVSRLPFLRGAPGLRVPACCAAR
jgi:limonene-1,2-epoxide hydrolase catalytic subunit